LLLNDCKSIGFIRLLTPVQFCGVTGHGPRADRTFGGINVLGIIKLVGVNKELVSSGFLCSDGSASKLFIFKAGALFAIIELNEFFGGLFDVVADIFALLLLGPSTGLFLLF